MAFLKAFGAYLPSRIVTNDEAGRLTGVTPEWIESVSGIVERRWAAEGETVADLAAAAGADCLSRAGIDGSKVGMLIVASGTAERRFPGPASVVARRLGMGEAPAVDLPIASAGSLVGLALAQRLADVYGNILVIGAEKMSSVVLREPVDRTTAVLFGDGAGACLVTAEAGGARVIDSALRSDGNFAEDLKLEFNAPLEMNGRSIIMQASRKIPRAIEELLQRNGRSASEVEVFLMHQANRNLLVRVAESLGVSAERFYSNIHAYGNTSSASMLIAAKEWWETGAASRGALIVFAAFGAGLHWGAMLVEAC